MADYRYDKYKEYVLKCSLVKIIANIDENSHIDKLKVLRAAADYVLCILSKEYNLSLNKKLSFDFFTSASSAGYFDTSSRKIMLDIDCFTKRDALINDLDTIIHEMRHYAQYSLKRIDGDSLCMNSISMQNCSELAAALAINGMLGTNVTKQNFARIYNKSYYKYYYYLNKLYYNRDVEMDARAYSINTIYDLLYDIDSIKLNDREQKNLEYFRSLAETIFNDEEENMTYTDASIAIPQKAIEAEVFKLQKDIINSFPNLFDIISTNLDELTKIDKNYGCDVCAALVQSLSVSYDDTLAHKLMQSFIVSIKNDTLVSNVKEYYQKVCNLYVYTDFNFTEKEIEILFGGNTNKDKNLSVLGKAKRQYKEYKQAHEIEN